MNEAELKQAYKDIISVWHPDRFSANPRLREKAEQKVKHINLAYETVCAYLSSPDAPREPAARGSGPDTASAASKKHTGELYGKPSKTEVAAELGTEVVLGVYAYVSRRLRQFIDQSSSI